MRTRRGRCDWHVGAGDDQEARQAPALLVQPVIEGRVQSGQILQQPLRFGDWLVGVEPERVLMQAEVMAVDGQHVVAQRCKQLLEFVDGLAQRSARLVAVALAPETRGQMLAQHVAWGGQGKHGEERPGFAVAGQE